MISKIIALLAVAFNLIVPLTPLISVTASASAGNGVVISQVKTGNSSTARLVELYNNSNEDIDVTGWCVYYASGTANPVSTMGASDVRACFEDNPVDLSERLLLPAYEYLLIAANLGDVSGDFVMSGGLGSGSTGHVFVVDNNKQIQDVLGWGTAAFAEGSPITISVDNTLRVLERKQSAPTQYIDTDNNVDDFFNSVLRDTYRIGSLVSVTDMCLNTPGLQAEVPEGYQRDNVSGFCYDSSILPTPEDPLALPCEEAIITELLPNPAGVDVGNEFIELHNPTDKDILLAGCSLKTSANNKEFHFGDITLGTGQYKAFYDSQTGLTLPNSAGGRVTYFGAHSEQVIEYPGGLKDNHAWALIEDSWLITDKITPDAANQVPSSTIVGGKGASQLEPCPEGKFRNPETNRCKNIESDNELKPCAPDQERNPETNRCRKIGGDSSTLKPCNPDQERNPETNRCRKIGGDSSTLKPCAPDQERNPETNRCRKISGSQSNPLTNPAVGQAPLNYPILGITTVAAMGYGVFEYRHDIRNWLSRLRR